MFFQVHGISLYSQTNNEIEFSNDEFNIINILFNDFINKLASNYDSEFLLLKQTIEWIDPSSNIISNFLLEYLKENISEELVENFIYNNKNNSGVISISNNFDINNVQVISEIHYNDQINKKLILLENLKNALDSKDEYKKYYYEIQKTALITISRIGFNSEKNEALISFTYCINVSRDNYHRLYILFEKHDENWEIKPLDILFLSF
jgi:hypothetical protein